MAARLGDEPAPEPSALRARAAALREDADGWTAAQLDGIEVACEVLDGARIPFTERVERCYGVRPAEVSEEAFEAAHERLGDALGGHGPLRERYARWRASQLVPPERVVPALEALLAELRARTRERFGLPDGEAVELELVQDEPWIAYAGYEGGLRTKISINRDVPATASRLLDIALHEVYPGHHTEHVHKDAHAGHAAFVYATQQALISEGIAMYAREALLGDGADALAAEILRPLGIAYDAEVAAVDSETWTALFPVRVNLDIRLDAGRTNEAGALEYARRWLVEDDEYVQKVVRDMLADPWPPYDCCYTEGMALCRAFCDREPDGFGRLLSEPLTTGDVSGRTIG
jgi:hypothetical protein